MNSHCAWLYFRFRCRSASALIAGNSSHFHRSTAAGSHRLYALWLLLICTGLRRGEALGLTLSDIDLETGEFRVRRNVQRIKRELLFGTPRR
ncbi:tyrosine-type recombinase/integrase [Streptomyces sp. NBC_01717]|uniref:tyrosine-type recombinase/integrase n=1 Tax=Streptomyces sp. NBC_01717 TaxID=2975918 RepID=UPI002E356494|nr:tyrosine-type recombinase/integrase [Streptomyces sp. NBC_01717]